MVSVAYHLRQVDSMLVGSSTAVNITAALKVAAKHGPGIRIVTMWCDNGDRAASKLYNPEFLVCSSNLDH